MVTSDQFAAKAVERRHLGITYEGNKNSEMCDAFVENTLKAAGGVNKNWEGSNTMLRKAVTAMYPLDMAKKQGLLERGMLLFIVAHDGGEPPQYQNDGLGNASHVGIYTDLKDPVNGEYVEVMHSSYTRGGVAASTLKNGWTHCGKYIGVGYAGSGTPAEDPASPDVPSAPPAGTVLIGVRLRKQPEIKSGNVIVGLDPGDCLEPTGAVREDNQGNFWMEGSITKNKTRHRGWAVARDANNVYIQTAGTDAQPPSPETPAQSNPPFQPKPKPPVDPTGPRMLRVIKGRPLQRGEDVRKVQRQLMALGYSVGQRGADGVYGWDTDAGVRSWQRATGRGVTGVLTPEDTSALLHSHAVQPPAAARYTATLTGLTDAQVAKLLSAWPTAIVAQTT